MLYLGYCQNFISHPFCRSESIESRLNDCLLFQRPILRLYVKSSARPHMTPLQCTGPLKMNSASPPMSFSTPSTLARPTSSVSLNTHRTQPAISLFYHQTNVYILYTNISQLVLFLFTNDFHQTSRCDPTQYQHFCHRNVNK